MDDEEREAPRRRSGREELPPPGFREPTFGQRVLARPIDSVVTLPVALLLGLFVHGVVRAGVLAIIGAGYEIGMVAWRGQTLGKMALGTRIVDRSSGGRPVLRQAVTRWLVLFGGALVAIIAPPLAFLAVVAVLVVVGPAMRSPLHLGLHDVSAGTIVTAKAHPVRRRMTA